MRRVFLLCVMVALAAVCKAIPLFPYFCDVAGDYKDGTPSQLQELGIVCGHYVQGPTVFYKNAADANSFLKDVLPFSSYRIVESENEINGAKVITYASPMGDDMVSELYIVEQPDGGFFIGYIEKKDVENAPSQAGNYF